jgi:hypothetical protein
MDTRTVTDWNELDYISMVGSSDLMSGVLPAGTRELVYVPNALAEGADTFGYAVSDCPFQLRRFSFAPIVVRILPARDRPDYGVTFFRVTDFALPRSTFSEADELPKGAMTISFRFRIFSRRQPTSLSCIGIRFQNRISFAVVPGGDLYFDLGDASFNIPTSGNTSFGWHHMAVSFDSATGVVKGYFDGQHRMTEVSYKPGQPSVATFGSGGIESFVLNSYAFIEREASTNSLSGSIITSPLSCQAPNTLCILVDSGRFGLYGFAVSSPNILQSGIGQIDDLAVWSRALDPDEVLRTYTNGIDPDTAGLSLYYDFNEGRGQIARNRGSAGNKYDLVLGRSDSGGPESFGVPNKYGGQDQIKFTAPVWSLATAQGLASDEARACTSAESGSTTRNRTAVIATGFSGSMFLYVTEGSAVSFILEYFHPAGLKCCVRIKKLPVRGRLVQRTKVGHEDEEVEIGSLPFAASSDAFASLVKRHTPLDLDSGAASCLRCIGVHSAAGLLEWRLSCLLGLRRCARISRGAVRLQVLCGEQLADCGCDLRKRCRGRGAWGAYPAEWKRCGHRGSHIRDHRAPTERQALHD